MLWLVLLLNDNQLRPKLRRFFPGAHFRRIVVVYGKSDQIVTVFNDKNLDYRKLQNADIHLFNKMFKTNQAKKARLVLQQECKTLDR